jgi:hypothetical protein
MAIPKFTGDEDKDEINPMEWLRMIKKYFKTPFIGRIKYLSGEYFKWWDSLDEGTKLSPTWENFEKIFSNKWIKDKKKWRRCIKFKWN